MNKIDALTDRLITKDWLFSKVAELSNENDKLKSIMKNIKEHAETCALFIWNDKPCNCHMKYISEFKEGSK